MYVYHIKLVYTSIKFVSDKDYKKQIPVRAYFQSFYYELGKVSIFLYVIEIFTASYFKNDYVFENESNRLREFLPY